jgi:diguanylate cyclase (GGDEF)-like protein
VDFYASDETVARVEADLARSETPAIATELAWHLRQRDTARSLRFATRTESALDARTESLRPRLILTCAECQLLRFRVDEAHREIARLKALGPEVGPTVMGDTAMLEASLANIEGNPRGEVECLRRAAQAYEEAGDRARVAYAKAQELASTTRDYQQEARDEIGRLRAASNDPALAAHLDYTAGILEFIASRFAPAVELLTPAAEGAHRAGATEVGLRSLLTIGAALSNLGNWDESAKVAEEALSRARALEWPRWAAAALAHLGRLFTFMEQPTRAVEVLEQAAELFSAQPQSRFYAMSLFYLGDAHLHGGDPVRAHEALVRSEQIVRRLALPPELSANLAFLARSLSRLGRNDEALATGNASLEMARSLGAKLWEAEALRSLAEIHAVGEPSTALRMLKEALDVSNALGGHHEKSQIWVEIARMHERMGDLASALSAERTARAEQLAEQHRRAANQALVSRMRHEMATLALREEEMRKLASTDPLTGLANRRQFFALAEAEVIRARRYGGSVGLIIGDIDKFKRINDTRGHPAGDAVLVAVALSLASGARPNDVVARLGGEEFAVLLPSADMPAVMAVAERLRAKVESLAVSWEGQPVPVTISLGCASADPAAGGPESPLTFFEVIVRHADEALYAAKAGGRNRVAASSNPVTTTA